MKKNRVLFIAMCTAILASFIPCFAADESLPAPLTYTVENAESLSPTASDNLAVDTSEEGKPEPTLPEVTPQPSYMGVVNLFAELSFVSFKDLNDQIAKSSNPVKITMAYVLGVDAVFSPFKGIPLGFGPRLEYLGCFTGKTSDFGVETDLTPSLIPIMLGGTYEFRVPSTPVTLACDIYAGYGIAKAIYQETGLTNNIDETLSGGSFVIDAGIKGSYEIFEATALGLSLGYRMANVPRMTYDKDDANNGISKGDVFKLNGTALKFDYSGLNIGIDINMKY